MMFDAIRYGLMVFACGAVLAGFARAEDSDANASDGPSRAELYEMRLRSDLGPNVSSLSAVLAQPFLIPAHILGDAIYGIDVSHYNDENCTCKVGQKCDQCKINWGQVPGQKIAFVYLKATQGARYSDPTFEHHWRTLAQHKIHRGAYHFMSADVDPVAQADYFVDQLEAAGKMTPTDMPPCLDLESDYRKDAAKKWIVADSGEKLDFWKGQEPEEILGKILKWLNRVEQRTGRIPMIYTSRGWWRDRIRDEKKFLLLKRYPLWIANYPESGRPAHDTPKVPNNQPWLIWQFTNNGKMNEAAILPGFVDVSVFRGTLPGFRQSFNLSGYEVEVARTDDAKDAAKPAQQLAAVNQNQANDASKAGAEVMEASAGQQAAPPAGKDATAQNVAAAATQRANSNTAVQQTAAASQAAEASKPAQQNAPTNPSQSAAAKNPAQQTAPPAPSASANQAANVSKPAQQTAAKAPASGNQGQRAEADKPAQQTQSVQQAAATQQAASAQSAQAAQQAKQAAKSPPIQIAEAKPPAPAAGGGNANQPQNQSQDAKAPAEQTASITPAAPAAAAKPNESGNTGEQPGGSAARSAQNPGTQKSATGGQAPAANRNSSLAAGQRAAAEKAPPNGAAGEKIMIEIELVNGRKVRVDANIDPSVLSRIIAAIDR
jgi:lysozyme